MTTPQERPLSESLRIFSGSSHPFLAREIAEDLGCTLCDRETRRFTNDNIFVRLGESVRGKDVIIIQSFSPNVSDNLLELLMMCDAARSASARTVHAVIPYYSYARSDKKDEPRISIAGRLIAELLETAGAQHVMAMELHSPQVHGFFSMPTDHLTSHPVFVRYLRSRDLSNAIVIAPDIGHAKRAAKLARALGIPVAAGDKERLADDRVHMAGIIGDVTGKHAIIFDDEIATGGTVVELVRLLRLQGVSQVTLACTHGVFSGPAVERLCEIPEIVEIITTNTVPLPPEKRLPKLTVLSVAFIFAEAIRRNLLGQSVGSLFAYWPDEKDTTSTP